MRRAEARVDLGAIERNAARLARELTGGAALCAGVKAEGDAVWGAAGGGLAGLMSPFATADERGDAFFGEQLERFRAWALPHKRDRSELVLHIANSAATLREADAHFDMVRCGIAVYGMD